MRKLNVNQPDAPAQPAPAAPAAAPVEQAPAPVAAPVEQAVAAPVLTPERIEMPNEIVPFSGTAMELGQPQQEVPVDAPQLPFLMFYDNRSNMAAQIIQALGAQIVAGTPVLVYGSEIFDASGFAFQILRHLQYWVVIEEGTWDRVAASLNPMPRGGEYTENIQTVTLFLPGRSPLPQGCTCIPTLTTWRSTKTDAVKGHLAAVDKTTTSEWIQASQFNSTLAGAVPPNYRVASGMRVDNVQGKKGFNYQTCKPLPGTVSPEQLSALQLWLQDPEEQAFLDLIKQGYESAEREVRDLAAKTAAARA